MAEVNEKCESCLKYFGPDELKKLKCSHQFCLNCLNRYLETHLNCRIKCPQSGCSVFIADLIIREILNDDNTEKYETICLDRLANKHRCILPECRSVVVYDTRNLQYECANCSLYNCISCGAAHTCLLTCEEYRSTESTTGIAVCQEELIRAKSIFDTKSAMLRRNSIAEASKYRAIPNPEIGSCIICEILIPKGAGVQLKNCFDKFCRNCLRDHINNSTIIPISCPQCGLQLDDAEIREFLTDEEKMHYDNRMITIAVPEKDGLFHCKSPDCNNCVIIEDKTLKEWTCNECHSINCVKCCAIHKGNSCEEYMAASDKKIGELIKRGELMKCPACGKILKKIGGCNWILCVCLTELCWITQTYRWGPKGYPDESGGCQCGLNGKMCHPECRGCHRSTAMINAQRNRNERAANNDTQQNRVEPTATNNDAPQNDGGSCSML